jgi:UDP-2,3-diacylglucosamine hydrolase
MLRYPAPSPVEGGIAIIADSHLGQVESDADDFLDSLWALQKRGFGTLVLLGDIFQYFIGDAKFETPMIRRVVDAWTSLAAAGVSIRYVEGNRDFFLANTPYSRSFAAYGKTDGLSAGGRRYAFVHGDRVNTRDLPYRFWLLVSKNPVSRAVMRILPGPVARSIVAKTEAKLYHSNFKHKKYLPERSLLLEGERARNAGYDEVLIGHFHVSKAFEAAAGVARLLPSWLQERKHAEISPEGVLTLVEEPSVERLRRLRPDFFMELPI